MKTFVMGDIHGGYKSLMQCLDRSKFNYKEDILIQLGDVSDGWSETPEVVEELLKINNLVPIRGNHDAWTLEYLEFGIMQDNHFNQGGKATKNSYTRKREEGTLEESLHLNFFKKQNNYYIDDQNRLFLHAGYKNENGVGYETDFSHYYWDRTLWNKAMSTQGNNILKKTSMYKEVYIGHTSTMMWNISYPMNKSNIWNLDTGGGFSGKLTIMNIDTKEFWQSDFVKDLYSDEKGR